MKDMRNVHIIIFFLLCLIGQAQNFPLSQNYNEAMIRNPAKTGQFKQNYQASLHHRSQWKTISNPFVTSLFSLETSWKAQQQKMLGVGLFVIQDKAGSSALKNMLIAGSLALNIPLDSKNQLAAGIQIGYRQRSINLNGLSWDSQHNGVNYDPTLSTGENFTSMQEKNMDAALGFFWKHDKRVKYDLGYTIFHYFQKQSFIVGDNDRLLPKQVVDFSIYLPYRQFDMELMSKNSIQGGSPEFLIGLLGSYRFGVDSRHTNNLTSSSLVAGCLYRYRDAIVPIIGYEYQRKVRAHLSYDINISKLKRISTFRGAWEITIQYKGIWRDKRRKMSELI